MNNKALVVIDIQNDITKNYRKIIDRINQAIDWALEENMQIIRHTGHLAVRLRRRSMRNWQQRSRLTSRWNTDYMAYK